MTSMITSGVVKQYKGWLFFPLCAKMLLAGIVQSCSDTSTGSVTDTAESGRHQFWRVLESLH